MPFSLHGTSTSFQRLMDRTVSDCAVVYIDDILIFSRSWEEHLVHLCRVLEALWLAGLVANRKKSHFSCSAVQYLGFNIGRGRVWPIQEKVEVFSKSPPTDPQGTSKFSGPGQLLLPVCATFFNAGCSTNWSHERGWKRKQSGPTYPSGFDSFRSSQKGLMWTNPVTHTFTKPTLYSAHRCVKLARDTPQGERPISVTSATSCLPLNVNTLL